MLQNQFLLIVIVAVLPATYGTSPPVFLPPLRCNAPQEPCGTRLCYNPKNEQCLKYKDGSGGIKCPFGDTFCNGMCLTPSSGKVCVERDDGGHTTEGICDPGQQLCGIGYCYSPDTQQCLGGAYICAKDEQLCGRFCYTASDSAKCVVGETGWSYVCKPDERVCGSAGCYNLQTQKCNESQHQISDI